MRNDFESNRLASETASADDRIDSICDAFEAAWLQGERPSLEQYLNAAAPQDQRALFSELLMLDHEYGGRTGNPVNAEEYLRQYPEYAAEIEALGFVGHWDDTVVEDREEPAPSPRSGRRFARFELIEKLGAGGAGEVWKARDLRLQRIVALKIPRRTQLEDQQLHRFLREARATAQLRHPNIVSVYEAGRDGSDAFIVSDYIDGQTLRDRLKSGPLTFQAAAELCALVADALHYAHAAGIVHRDVKPANVILDKQQQPYVTDFGLAKWTADVQELTLHGQLIGTPAYMSPEQARGGGASVDSRADIFAAGVMLYEMLTGACPFQGDQSAVVRAVIDADPVRPRRLNRSIPRDLETICLKAIEKNPDQRYATAQAMALDLRRFLRGEPILARRSGLVRRAWKLAKRRPAAVAAALLFVAAIGASAFATATAKQNRQLQGYRTVLLETEPRGARVAFVPLSKATGEPQPEQAILAGDDNTIVEQLKPGDYWVVAALADGRFQEVYRHVPDPLESLPGSHNHRRSSLEADGSVRLPKITIPNLKVAESMAYFTGSDAFVMGVAGSDQVPQHRRRVAPFYMDLRECAVADAPRRSSESRPFRERLPAEAISVDFDWALAYAEHLGKRLPTETEYEFAATAGGTSRFPWGDQLDEFHPTAFVTDPIDLHQADSRLTGLCSGKAEWTVSWCVPYETGFIGTSRIDPRLWRVIRGGDLETAAGNPGVTAESRDPRHRHFAERDRPLPGLGFRCVRSAVPLISFEEME